MTQKIETSERRMFGVPAVLGKLEAENLFNDLVNLWSLAYGDPLSDIESDLQRCRWYCDPRMRGKTLRDRLDQLAPASADLVRRAKLLCEPLVIRAGADRFIVGVEARLVLDLLDGRYARGGHVVVPAEAVSSAERQAMQLYREWSLALLDQVVALRAGKGAEVMQAIAVGLVLALLVNRSDSIERAVPRQDNMTDDGRDVNTAIYAGANAFAKVVTPRQGRSSGEQSLKRGYGLSEARRRLSDYIFDCEDPRNGVSLVYLDGGRRSTIVEFLGRDLARRPTLTSEKLEAAFDALVSSFRVTTGALAWRSMVFEHANETNMLRSLLISSFNNARDPSV